ncbi:hypothetical protein MHYP_G00320340 [Metynnis hypsauchen]
MDGKPRGSSRAWLTSCSRPTCLSPSLLGPSRHGPPQARLQRRRRRTGVPSAGKWHETRKGRAVSALRLTGQSEIQQSRGVWELVPPSASVWRVRRRAGFPAHEDEEEEEEEKHRYSLVCSRREDVVHALPRRVRSVHASQPGSLTPRHATPRSLAAVNGDGRVSGGVACGNWAELTATQSNDGVTCSRCSRRPAIGTLLPITP